MSVSSKAWSSLPTKATPIGTDILAILDSEDGNSTTKNKTIQISALSGATAITSINASTIPAQIIAAGTGLGIVDAGAIHTLSIDSTVATLTGTQILTNKTLTTPTIASFVNATHNHQAPAGGDTLLSTSALSDTANIAYLNTANTYSASVIQNFGTSNIVNVGALGINTVTPLRALDVQGGTDYTFTATTSDVDALSISVNANTFGDVKGLDISYNTGALLVGSDNTIILIDIDEVSSINGILNGYEILTTNVQPNTKKIGMKIGIGIDPIEQSSGTFVGATRILVNVINETATLSVLAGTVSVFVNDNDTITIGSTSKFEEIEFIIPTIASGTGVVPTFEFSTGPTSFSVFSPTDGTRGFRNTGAVAFDESLIPGWVADTNSEFSIRITRTADTLTTTPILSLIQISPVTLFSWDKLGNIAINTLNTNTIPAGTDTFAMLAATQTLTNKTISLGSNTISGTKAQFNTSLTDGTFAFPTDNLSVFAATTSAQLAGVISDETGSGLLVFGTSPTLVTPALGIPTALVLTNATGLTNSGLTSGVFSNITGIGTQTQALNMGSNLINSVTDPVSAQDAATKNYVDSISINGVKWKESVKVASTGNLTLTGEQTIDGVATSTDRILVKDQTLGQNNGIYITAAGAWSRSTDADTSVEILQMAVFVQEGTANADQGFVLTTDTPIILGTTVLVYTQFSGLGQIIAGTNLSKTANTINWDPTGGVNFLTNNVTNMGTLNSHTIPAGTDTFAMLAATQILTNKTLTTPTIASFVNATHNHQAASGGNTLVATSALTATGVKDATTFLRGDNTWEVPAGSGDMLLAGIQTVTGVKTFGTIGGVVGKFALAGSTSGSTILNAAATAGAGTVVLPTTGTLSTLAQTETLINKTLTTPTIVATGFTNMQHTHQAANTGSQLVATLALTATGVKDATTFLRGDDTWATPAGAGDMVLAGIQIVTGAKTFGTIGGAVGKFILAGSTSGSTILNAAAVAGAGTVVLPITGTLSTLAQTETLSLKTLITPTIASFVNAIHNHTNAAGASPLVATTALTATGTKDSTTFLRGDDTWATPPGGAPPFDDGTALVKGSVDATKLLRFEVDGNTAAITGVISTIFTTAKTITIPDATDTLVGKATIDVLINKSISLTTNTLTGTSAELATAISDETGAGSLVFGTSPTIVTPTIASFVNATHNHTNAAGGGLLTTLGTITTGVWNGTVITSSFLDADTAHLTTTQTFSGLKTFTLLAAFTAGIDVTGANIDNIQNLIHDISVSGIDIDFAEDELQTISIAVNTIFTTANRVAGKSKTLKITTDATLRTFTFPAWDWVSAIPADQAASKNGYLTLTCYGTTDASIVAAYQVGSL